MASIEEGTELHSTELRKQLRRVPAVPSDIRDSIDTRLLWGEDAINKAFKITSFLLKHREDILFLFPSVSGVPAISLSIDCLSAYRNRKSHPLLSWPVRLGGVGHIASARVVRVAPGNFTSPFDWLHHQELGVNTHAKLAIGRCGYFQQDKNSRQFYHETALPHLPWSHSANILARYLARRGVRPFGLRPNGCPHFLVSRRLPTDRINKSQRRRKKNTKRILSLGRIALHDTTTEPPTTARIPITPRLPNLVSIHP